MVICKRCQSDNNEQTRFCTFCGGRLPGRVELIGGSNATPSPAGSKATLSSRPGPSRDPEAESRYVQKVVYQHFIRAKELIRERKFDLAIKEFKKALEASPGEPTITEMMGKTVAAQKAAQAARGEPQAPVKFRPSSVPEPRQPAPPPPQAAFSGGGSRHPARKQAADQWLKTLAASPSLYPSMVLDTPSHDRILEVAVSLFILGGFFFFGFLLMY